MLWQLCREAKDAQHLTNQIIADRSGLALNTVSQYLRGESKSASVYTVGPICNALGIDLNGLVDYASSLYNSFKNGGSSSSGILSTIGKAIGSIFGAIGNFFQGLFGRS